ncbi:hypothetical protein [Eikenella halliae]|uniref:hypothetical protein n=1 Tax=Eikenella halliae TaxID=1795832 RepID=UPI0036191616
MLAAKPQTKSAQIRLPETQTQFSGSLPFSIHPFPTSLTPSLKRLPETRFAA